MIGPTKQADSVIEKQSSGSDVLAPCGSSAVRSPLEVEIEKKVFFLCVLVCVYVHGTVHSHCVCGGQQQKGKQEVKYKSAFVCAACRVCVCGEVE